MKFYILKTRRGRLKTKIEELLPKKDIENILKAVDDYEKDNLDTIEKLKRGRSLELNKINGALRQAINAHGPITKVLIGSATKRVYGALLEPHPNETLITKIIKWARLE
jgi:hypothetical protein